MRPVEIIPAIDIIEGKCVRLSQGDYSRQTTYYENPLEVARMFEGAGLRRLHLVDLDGARAKHIVNYRVLESIASKTSLVIDFGGGLKSDEDLRIAFTSGATMVTGGSIAVKEPARFLEWLANYGSEKIILGADARNGKISVEGWQEDSDLEIIDFIQRYTDEGIRQVISTDIDRDGMLEGPAFGLYTDILEKFPELMLIASGGVSSMRDIYQLGNRNVPAVITGKAIYEGHITLKEIENYLIENY